MPEPVQNIRSSSSVDDCSRLLTQGYQKAKLASTFNKKFYGRRHEVDDTYDVAASRLISDILPPTNFILVVHSLPIILFLLGSDL